MEKRRGRGGDRRIGETGRGRPQPARAASPTTVTTTAPKDAPGIRNPYVRFRPLKKPPIAEHQTTLWDYPSQHYGKGEQGSAGYRGATPSHVIWNVVSRYTKAEDLVVDPFCGSGTTIDVCKDLGRRAKGFDLAPSRTDIIHGDARELARLVQRETAHLVFFDPPYAQNLTYSDDPGCIGKLTYDDGAWTAAMGRVVREAEKVLKPGGVLAAFVCDVLDVKSRDQRFLPLGLDLAMLGRDAGLTLFDHVAVVRHGKALEDPRLRARAAAEGFMLRGFSHLLLFRKGAATLGVGTTTPAQQSSSAQGRARKGRR